jgi:general secretion pathway protein B
MSFILDALKKSEVERQRQTVPGLMDAGRAPQRRRFPLWAAALGVLLLINLAVLTWLLLRHQSAAAGPAEAAAPSAAPLARPAPAGEQPSLPIAARPPAAAVPAAGSEHFSPMDGPPSYAPEIPLASADAVPAAAEAAPPARRSTAAAPALPAPRAADEPDEVLPTLSELNLTGPDAPPELHLDVHVWATSSADRFVFINGHKYREGAHLREGPTLERIRRDGVVLDSHGTRFLLPRDQ